MGQDLVAVERGPDDIGTEHVHEWQRVGSRWNPVKIKRNEVLGMLKDPAQIDRETLDLVLAEFEPRESGDVLGIGASDSGCHDGESTIRSRRNPEDLSAEACFLVR